LKLRGLVFQNEKIQNPGLRLAGASERVAETVGNIKNQDGKPAYSACVNYAEVLRNREIINNKQGPLL
jgi:hypothetical protein